MKSLVVLIILIAVLALPISVNAASSESDIVKEISVQQKMYDEHTKLATDYLDVLIYGKLTFDEKDEVRKKQRESRKIFLTAAAKMLELKKELYEIKNKIPNSRI